MISIEKVEEYIKNTTDAKIMDVNSANNTIEITNTNSEDLQTIKNSGLDSVRINTNSMVFEIINQKEFKKSYNEWVEEEKKF